MFILTDEIRQEMLDAAEDAYPGEACGVVAGGVCYRLPNSADDAHHFRLLGSDIERVASPHGGYDAVWHSHPSGSVEPSHSDWANHPCGKALVIVASGTVNVYGVQKA